MKATYAQRLTPVDRFVCVYYNKCVWVCVCEREREREREGKLMAARMKKVYPGADLKPQNKQYEIESIHHRPPDGKFVFCHFFLFLSLSLSLCLCLFIILLFVLSPLFSFFLCWLFCSATTYLPHHHRHHHRPILIWSIVEKFSSITFKRRKALSVRFGSENLLQNIEKSVSAFTLI